MHSEHSIHTSNAVPAADWDQFLRSVPDGHHLQSSLWAGVKASEGWKSERIVATENGRILGGLQLLHREVSRGSRVAYVPRGPVISSKFGPVARILMESLLRVAKSLRIGYLTVQPPRCCQEFVRNLEQTGFIVSPADSAPTATVLINTQQSDEALMRDMRKTVRRALRKAQVGPLKIRIGTEADLPVFHSLMAATARRQGFNPWTLDHLRTVWRQFAPSDHIVLFLAEKEGIPLAGEMEITFGDTMVSKRSGWSGLFPKEHPSELLVWHALLWARERGLKWFDMEGFDRRLALALKSGQEIPMEKRLNHHWFKAGFGGSIEVLPQNYELVLFPVLGWIHRTLWGRILPPHFRHALMRQCRSLLQTRTRRC